MLDQSYLVKTYISLKRQYNIKWNEKWGITNFVRRWYLFYCTYPMNILMKIMHYILKIEQNENCRIFYYSYPMGVLINYYDTFLI